MTPQTKQALCALAHATLKALGCDCGDPGPQPAPNVIGTVQATTDAGGFVTRSLVLGNETEGSGGTLPNGQGLDRRYQGGVVLTAGADPFVMPVANIAAMFPGRTPAQLIGDQLVPIVAEVVIPAGASVVLAAT